MGAEVAKPPAHAALLEPREGSVDRGGVPSPSPCSGVIPARPSVRLSPPCHLPNDSCPGQSRLFKAPRAVLGNSVSAAPAGAQHRDGVYQQHRQRSLRPGWDLQYFPHSRPFLLLLTACRHCSLSRNEQEKVLAQCQLFHTFLALQGATTRNPQHFWA